MDFNRLYILSESRFYNDTLSLRFWEDDELYPDIRKKLLSISSDVITEMEISRVVDIQLTGSIANYNYTKFSDIDVHIIVDFSKINPDQDIVKDALDGKRFAWNLKHNIILRGHEVEIYFQNVAEQHISSGLYSIKDDRWVRVPKFDPPEVDERDVMKKAGAIESDVARLEAGVLNQLTPSEARMYNERATALFRKIRRMRESGLKEEGEFSVENLAFKELRNHDVIDRLVKIAALAYDKIYNESVVTGVPLKTFSDVFSRGKGKDKTYTTGPRHRKWGTGLTRTTGQNMVPDMHRKDPTLNSKVETLRDRKNGKLVLNQADLNYIVPKYNVVNLSTDCTRENPKRLGTSNIILYHDASINSFCIEKI